MKDLTIAIPVQGALFEQLALDFLCSARTLGKHAGPIIVIEFDTSDSFKQQASQYEVEFIRAVDFRSKHAINDRFTQFRYAVPNVTTSYMALFDSDIWFRQPIENLVNLLPQDGVLFTPARDRGKAWSRGKDIKLAWPYFGPEKLYDTYIKQVELIVNKCGRILNGGLIAGTTSNIRSMLREYDKFVSLDGIIDDYMLETCALMMIYDENKDIIGGQEYNYLVKDELDNDSKVIHLVGKAKHVNKLWFRNNYPELFDAEWSSG